MTRFVGEAIGARGPKFPTSVSSKSMKKNMEKFAATGVHPDLERAHLERMRDTANRPLPELDPNRPFVFMDLSIGNKPAGRFVIELFDDLVPMGAEQLRNQLMPGSRKGLSGSCSHRLIPHYALFFGSSRPEGADGLVQISPNNTLRTVEAGVVSVSFEAGEVSISLAPATNLDNTHQVVGRVHQGKELIERINEISINPDDTPTQRISISKCGMTNMKGDHETLEDSGSGGPPKDPATRLREESAIARSAVLQALQVGLASGSADREGKGGGGGAAGGGASGSGTATRTGVTGAGGRGKAKMLDAMLGGLSGSDDDSSEDAD